MSAFDDVEPVEQDDGPQPVVPIAYPPQYVALMNIFRAMLATGETSPRVLDLTGQILEYNAAHYTVWHIRRKCLFALALDGDDAMIRDELEYAESVASSSPKNYQVWYHRRELIERIGRTCAEAELDFIAEMLESDTKNYHAWSQRQWLLRLFECWGRELAYTDALLDADVWNNSAWNHRYLVVQATRPGAAAAAEREVEYALRRTEQAPSNESAWTYALAFARLDASAAAALALACQRSIGDAAPPLDDCDCDEDLEKVSRSEDCAHPHAHATLLELEAARGGLEAVSAAAQLARVLAASLDAPREKYWRSRARQLDERALALKA